jgi:hypothetical protein
MDYNLEYLLNHQSPEVDYKLQVEFSSSFQHCWRRKSGTVECQTMLALAMLRSRLDWCQSVSKVEGSASPPSSMPLMLVFLSTYWLFDAKKLSGNEIFLVKFVFLFEIEVRAVWMIEFTVCACQPCQLNKASREIENWKVYWRQGGQKLNKISVIPYWDTEYGTRRDR